MLVPRLLYVVLLYTVHNNITCVSVFLLFLALACVYPHCKMFTHCKLIMFPYFQFKSGFYSIIDCIHKYQYAHCGRLKAGSYRFVICNTKSKIKHFRTIIYTYLV